MSNPPYKVDVDWTVLNRNHSPISSPIYRETNPEYESISNAGRDT